MRIALISDIHGNYPALQAVLQSIIEEGADKIICLGDVCYGGSQPAECLRAIRARTDFCVMGNTDSTLIKAKNGAHTEDTRVADAVNTLSDEEHLYLSSLPLLQEIPLPGGFTLKAFHGTMESNNDVYQSSDIEALAKTNPAQVLYVCGHTHTPFYAQYGHVRFINPGSVGVNWQRNEDGSKTVLPIACYCLVKTVPSVSVSFVQLDL